MIKTLCSNGERISDATAQRRYSEMLKEKYQGFTRIICGGCREVFSVHNDHTIAKARCKVIHKTELIYHPDNIVRSCQRCHDQWESMKSGDWLNHKNVEQRLAFLKEHDSEGFKIRIELTKLALEQDDSTTTSEEAKRQPTFD